MFLTADGKPIVGGTYWPQEDKKVDEGTARGFKSILATIIELERDKAKELRKQADKVAELNRRGDDPGRPRLIAAGRADEAAGDGPGRRAARPARPRVRRLRQADREFRGTKFPQPPPMSALLHAADPAQDKDADLAELVTLTLTKMAEGGHLRPARRRLPSLQHRAHLDRAALREDALRQRPARRALSRGVPRRPEAALQARRRGDDRVRFVREMTVAGRRASTPPSTPTATARKASSTSGRARRSTRRWARE